MQQQKLRKFSFLGYLLDLYRILTFTFTNPHSLTKFLLIKKFQKEKNLSCFVETGTYLGITTMRCSFIFDQVWTIEVSESLASKASDFLKKRKNVNIICDDALNALPQIMNQQSLSKALIFLDGHFSGEITGQGSIPEPAIDELKILAEFKNKIEAIIIDDFRTFGKEHGFPSKSELLKAAETYFGEYKISVYLDQLILIK
jgi:hypothetical protein